VKYSTPTTHLGAVPLKEVLTVAEIALPHFDTMIDEADTRSGATGAILTVKCMYELVRTHGRFGLITMCIGGGQGVALSIEAIH
jgi:hypothetical protein